MRPFCFPCDDIEETTPSRSFDSVCNFNVCKISASSAGRLSACDGTGVAAQAGLVVSSDAICMVAKRMPLYLLRVIVRGRQMEQNHQS